MKGLPTGIVTFLSSQEAEANSLPKKRNGDRYCARGSPQEWTCDCPTFASDGPDHCSRLEVVRYTSEHLDDQFGEGFKIVDITHETHHTPFGTEQKFVSCFRCKD